MNIEAFRERIQARYSEEPQEYWDGGLFKSGDFGEILCFEIHSVKCDARAPQGGLTFRELAEKWGISVSFLGKLIADHCDKLEDR